MGEALLGVGTILGGNIAGGKTAEMVGKLFPDPADPSGAIFEAQKQAIEKGGKAYEKQLGYSRDVYKNALQTIMGMGSPLTKAGYDALDIFGETIGVAAPPVPSSILASIAAGKTPLVQGVQAALPGIPIENIMKDVYKASGGISAGTTQQYTFKQPRTTTVQTARGPRTIAAFDQTAYNPQTQRYEPIIDTLQGTEVVPLTIQEKNDPVWKRMVEEAELNLVNQLYGGGASGAALGGYYSGAGANYVDAGTTGYIGNLTGEQIAALSPASKDPKGAKPQQTPENIAMRHAFTAQQGLIDEYRRQKEAGYIPDISILTDALNDYLAAHPEYASTLPQRPTALDRFKSTPQYNVMVDQLENTQRALSRQAAQKGLLGSGNYAYELQEENRKIAEQNFNKYQQNLLAQTQLGADMTQALFGPIFNTGQSEANIYNLIGQNRLQGSLAIGRAKADAIQRSTLYELAKDSGLTANMMGAIGGSEYMGGGAQPSGGGRASLFSGGGGGGSNFGYYQGLDSNGKFYSFYQ